jgi:hypothetical protein
MDYAPEKDSVSETFTHKDYDTVPSDQRYTVTITREFDFEGEKVEDFNPS